MSEEMRQPADHGGFEREDLSAKAVFAFLAGLAVLGAAIPVLLWGMYSYLDRYSAQHQPRQNPLAPAAQADTRFVSDQDTAKFPTPRLEKNEQQDLNEVRLQEEKTLHSYDWVDEKAGVVRIPIERAMELIARKGLPVRPPEGSVAAEKKGKSQAGNAPAAKH